MPILFRDYETRSTLDLRNVGAWKYSTAPTTDVWCCAYATGDGSINLWVPGDPVPAEFIEASANPEWLVSAFNDTFERLIEQHIMGPRYGWPLIPIERHRCTQAAALSLALPAKLEKVAEALALEQRKDVAGHAVMKRLARPRKPRKDEDPGKVYWHDEPELLAQLYAYCKQDMATERAVHARVGHLSPEEQQLWQLDATINDRGIHIDTGLLDAALRIGDAAQEAINVEVQQLTGGTIETIGQVEKLIAWLADNDCEVKDLKKGTLKHALRRTSLSAPARRAIELRLEGAHAAAAKFETMRDWLGADNHMRGAFKYHGAATGRWTSYGVQVQNFKRPTVEDLGAAIEAVATGNLDHVKQHYAQPMAIVGDIARATICAAPGHRLIAADFSGVESRLTAWLADQQSKLDQWGKFDQTQNAEDEPYYVLGKQLGFPQQQARALGKVADLAFGYMGGEGAWRRLAPEDDNSNTEQIGQRKHAWRNAHPAIVKLWYALEREAIRAVNHPGKAFVVNHKLAFRCDGDFLRMRLPSGRKIAYPFPSLHTNGHGDTVVMFKDNAAGKFVDCRHGHGALPGLWIENAVQAVARDLFAAGLLRLEAAGYPITLHIHDEIVAEVPDGIGSADDFLKILVQPPDWAAGLPIAAKVRNGPRFAKIKPAAETAAEPGPEMKPDDDAEQDHEETPRGNGHAEPKFNGSRPPPEDDADYSAGERPWGRNLAEYVYHAKDGTPYLKVVRTSAKQFPQYHWNGGGWALGKPQGPKIPYRLPELLAAAASEPVWITEGEKDAENVAALGLIATTNSEGAGKGKWTADLNQWFTGKQTVYITEDNDADGRRHTTEVANALLGIIPEIRIVSFPELPAKGDVSDWLDAGATRKQLIERAKTAPKFEPPKLPFIDMSRWDDEDPPPREWAVDNRIPLYQTALFSGEGATGKSTLLLQQCFAHTLVREWLGVVPKPGPALFVDAEDDKKEVHRRAKSVTAYYEATFNEAIRGGLHLMSFAGEDAVLATVSRSGKIEPTPLYGLLLEAVGDIRPVMVGIASSANVFAGNENDRAQVQQFVGLLTHMAILAGGAVQLISHPSLTGINTESGISGTTQWHNAVRARCYLKSIKPEAGEQPDNDLREIVFKKNQYGPISESIVLRYQNGLFLPVPGVNSLDQAARQATAQDVFLALLKRFNAQNRDVSSRPSVSYAPALFAREAEAKTAMLSSKQLEAAMRQLFKDNRIWNEPCGKPSRPRFRLAVK